jgi:hypothetical protein
VTNGDGLPRSDGLLRWNPIEHRLFSQISLNWVGKPLRARETMLGNIRAATTATGLTIEACLLDEGFPTGQSVPDAKMQAIRLDRHDVCSTRNDTLAVDLPFLLRRLTPSRLRWSPRPFAVACRYCAAFESNSISSRIRPIAPSDWFGG